MASLSSIIKNLVVRDSSGNVVTLKFDAKYINKTGGGTVQTHIDDTDAHVTAAEHALLKEFNAAKKLVQIGTNGKIPSNLVDIPKGTTTNYERATYADLSDIGSPNAGDTCFVSDATGDSTVAAGWAIYRYNGTAWEKIQEKEGLDIVIPTTIDWANVQNKPTSTVTDIDAAVTAFKDGSVGGVYSKIVTEIPAEWPADVNESGVLYLVESMPA